MVSLVIVGFFTLAVSQVNWRVALPSSSPEWSIVTGPESRNDDEKTIKVKGFTNLIRVPNSALTPREQQQTISRIVRGLWRREFVDPLAKGLGITLALALGVYGLVRAIGWVIGGFMSS